MKYVKRQILFFIGYLVVGALLVVAALLWSPAQQREGILTMRTQSTVHSVTIMIVCAGTFVSLIYGYRDITLTLSALLIIEVILYICFGTYYGKKY